MPVREKSRYHDVIFAVAIFHRIVSLEQAVAVAVLIDLLCFMSWKRFILLIGLGGTGHAFQLRYKFCLPASRNNSEIASRSNKKASNTGGRGSTPKTKTEIDQDHNIPVEVARDTMPASTQRVDITLQRGPQIQKQQLHVCIAQVVDEKWWERSSNPFGARCWPSSLAVAQFLAQGSNLLPGRSVLELGCGTGLVSIVAAKCGAIVLATDISPVALKLTKQGWKDTCSQIHVTSAESLMGIGSLSTVTFDLTSVMSLPVFQKNPRDNQTGNKKESDACLDNATSLNLRPIVVAGTMMYTAELAQVMARRVAEAVLLGAWVIVGDDETGHRENGREIFEVELSRLLDTSDQTIWTKSTVKCKSLGWKEKQVTVLHINPPSGVLDDGTYQRNNEIKDGNVLE